MRQLIILSIYLLVMGMAMNSCTKAVIDEEPIIVNVPADTSDTNTTLQKLVYDPGIKKIMTDNCITCHGGPAPSAGLNLENYTSVKTATETGKLIDRINDQTNPMPQRGLMPLSVRKQIEAWKTDGFKEK